MIIITIALALGSLACFMRVAYMFGKRSGQRSDL
jgi:hypothetical protein